MIDERREGGVSPRACFFSIDRFWAELYKGPGNTGNGRRQQKVKFAKEFSERGSDSCACAKAGSHLQPTQGKTAFDLPGHVWIKLPGVFLEICAIERGESRMLQRHQRFLGRAGRPDRITTDNSLSSFAEMFDEDLQPSSNGGIDGCVEPQLRRECDTQISQIDVTAFNQGGIQNRGDRGPPWLRMRALHRRRFARWARSRICRKTARRTRDHMEWRHTMA